MKKLLFSVFAIMVLASFSMKAQTVLDFTLVNATGEDLYGMHVSEVSDNNWGEDIIPTDILPDGNQVEVQFTDEGDKNCNWDIKLTKDADGNSVTISNVNLCGITIITLTKNGNKYVYKTE